MLYRPLFIASPSYYDTALIVKLLIAHQELTDTCPSKPFDQAYGGGCRVNACSCLQAGTEGLRVRLEDAEKRNGAG